MIDRTTITRQCYWILFLAVFLMLPTDLKALNDLTTNQQDNQQFRMTTDTQNDKPSFRNGASNLLEINIAAVTENGKLNAKSPEWAKLNTAVKGLLKNKKTNNLLHVRLFISNNDKGSHRSVKAIKANVKKVLADIDVYVVCVDIMSRNDEMTWKSFVDKK